MKKFLYPLIITLLFLIAPSLHSQELIAGIQIRPRFEYRNGFKTLLASEQQSTNFISQRSRFIAHYNFDQVSVKLSLQNVRTWGEVPTVTVGDKNGIMVFEAYLASLM